MYNTTFCVDSDVGQAAGGDGSGDGGGPAGGDFDESWHMLHALALACEQVCVCVCVHTHAHHTPSVVCKIGQVAVEYSNSGQLVAECRLKAI